MQRAGCIRWLNESVLMRESESWEAYADISIDEIVKTDTRGRDWSS